MTNHRTQFPESGCSPTAGPEECCRQTLLRLFHEFGSRSEKFDNTYLALMKVESCFSLPTSKHSHT